MPSLVLRSWRQHRSPDRTLWIIGFGVAISLLGDLTLYIVLPTHTKDAGITLANVGLMLSANRLIRIILNGPIGLLIERTPRRQIAVPSLFLGGLSSLLYTIPGFWPLLVGRLSWGIAWAGLWLSASTMVLDFTEDRNRGRLIGRLQMWYFIGIGFSSLIGGALTDWIGYTANFAVCAAITLAGAIFWWLFLPETRAAERIDSLVSSADAPEIPAAVRSSFSPKTKAPLIAAIVLLGINWLIFLGMFGAILPLLLEERMGDEIAVLGILIPLTTFTGALVAGNQVVSLLVSPLTGWLSDYTRQRWGLVIVALVLGIAAMGLTAIGHGILIITATMISAVATSALQTQVMILVGDYTQAHQRGRILGILNTVGDLGSAGGPLIAYGLLTIISLKSILGLATAMLIAVVPWIIWITYQEAQKKHYDRTYFSCKTT